MASKDLHQISLRLPESMYQNLKQLATVRKTSLNKLAKDTLQSLIDEELEKQLKIAYDVLGDDPDEVDVEVFAAAQREVLVSE